MLTAYRSEVQQAKVRKTQGKRKFRPADSCFLLSVVQRNTWTNFKILPWF